VARYDRSIPICQNSRSSFTTSCQIYVRRSNRSGEGRSAATLFSRFSTISHGHTICLQQSTSSLSIGEGGLNEDEAKRIQQGEV